MADAGSSSGVQDSLPPSLGNYITVLSIDGGGMRGLIPLVILEELEQELQDLINKGKNTGKRPETEGLEKTTGDKLPVTEGLIADYFDVIAGTSTGGLIASLLATPKDKEIDKRPKYTAKEITELYEKMGPKIFKSKRPAYFLWGPKYGISREKVIKDEMLDLKLSDTVTNVVVPTFDINMMAPIIFSSFKNNNPRSLQYKLSDVCIATTAAPTYFRPYPMKGKEDLNLVDGGMVANNPTMIAIAAVERQIANRNEDFLVLGGSMAANSPAIVATEDNLKTEGFKKYLILSIGTEYNRGTEKYTAARVKKLGKIQWARPAINMLCCASEFMVNFNVAIFLQSQGDPDNYLRIQATDGRFSDKKLPLDAAKESDIADLKRIGKILLDENEGRSDKITMQFTSANQKLTNREALKAFARVLFEEHEYRIKKRSGQTPMAFQKLSKVRENLIKNKKETEAPLQNGLSSVDTSTNYENFFG